MKFETREYNGVRSRVANTEAKLISVSDKVLTNSNGNEFRACTIELNGKNVPALTYNKSPEDLNVGGDVDVEISRQEGDSTMYFRVLWNAGGEQVTVEDFEEMFGETVGDFEETSETVEA